MFLVLSIGPWIYVQLRPDPPELVAVPVRFQTDSTYRVYVANWGYHTSIIVPQLPSLALGPANDPGAAYVEFAWGDRSFFMESNFWPHRVFATLLLPTGSVTYVVGWARAPTNTDGMVKLWSRTVTSAQLARLVGAVEGTIRRTSDMRRLEAYPPAKGYRGRFYPAHGHYLFWADCNRWTVDRLHAAGLAESGTGVILAGQVAGRLDGFVEE